MESVHKTVLLKEAIEGLNLSGSPVVVDGTFGGGGHSKEICEKYPKAKIVAIDKDETAFQKAKDKFQNLNCDISFHTANFRDIDEVLKVEKIEEVDGIIFDLGFSSDQLETSARGFSFLKDEPLLMTMSAHPKEEELTAEDIVNDWGEENIATIIYGYGEERYSRQIAKAIVEARGKKRIKTTVDLVEVIKGAVPKGYRLGKIHPATKTFQALRIAVNDELGALREGLEKGFDALKKDGRIAIITFHSLEDRIVKRFYKSKVIEGQGRIINKKVIRATLEEIKQNPRARSAKLRILEKKKDI